MRTPFFNQHHGGNAPAPISSPHPSPALPEAARLDRLSICTVCEHNQNGLCAKCQYCGGRTIAQKVQTVFEFCPLTPPKWKQWIQPKEFI